MKPIYKLGHADCRWPLSTNTEGVRLFCAEPCDSPAQYCGPHEARSLPAGAEARPASRRLFLANRAVTTAPWVVKPFGQEAREVSGQRPPKQKRTEVYGAKGALVDDDGYEIADREPDLVALFASAR